jgi:hypothetical protein
MLQAPEGVARACKASILTLASRHSKPKRDAAVFPHRTATALFGQSVGSPAGTPGASSSADEALPSDSSRQDGASAAFNSGRIGMDSDGSGVPQPPDQQDLA